MIPQFPVFKKVELSDRNDVMQYVRHYPPYSDFNFTSLWAWDVSEARAISELNGNLVFRLTDYQTHEPFFSFLGTSAPERTARELMRYATEHDLSPVLRLIPEEAVEGMRPSVLCIKEDRNNFDYIYSIAEQASLKGNQFKNKRQARQRFLNSYPTARFEVADITDALIHEHVLHVLSHWNDMKDSIQQSNELKHEQVTIRRLLAAAGHHELIVGGVFIDGRMIAFSIDEILPHQFSIEHFSKADKQYTGVYEFLNYEMAKHLDARDIVYWNWEQDLGIESLCKSKVGYRPVRFLKKYEVSLAAEHGML